MTQAPRASISACIITLDEALDLPACLASVDFCQEKIVVDSGSSDGTVELARAAGARVIAQPWLGFAAQRNVALDHATCDWVIEIDADERVTPQLRAELEAFLESGGEDVQLCAVPRREIFLGRPLGRSAKYPKYFHRVLRRGTYRHDEARTVHEGFEPHDAVYPFEGSLEHLLARGWREAFADNWRYASLEAAQMHSPRTPAAVIKGALLRPCVKFLYRTTIDGGWRDGPLGLFSIALECLTDTVVWARHALGMNDGGQGDSGVPAGAHYGARRTLTGSVRLVALATGPSATEHAIRWLSDARARGADVSLISGCSPTATEGIRVREAKTGRPLALIRALDAEEQLRTMDAVLAFGAQSRLALALVPNHLCGARGRLSPESPQIVLDRCLEARKR